MDAVLAKALHDSATNAIEQFLYVHLEELLRRPSPPQAALLAGALQCDIAASLGMLDAAGDLFPRVLAQVPESHIRQFRTQILAMAGVSAALRCSLAEHIDDLGSAIHALDAPGDDEPFRVSIDMTIVDGIAVVEPAGDLDRTAIPALKTAIETASVQGRRGVVTDFSRAQVLAPSVLAALADLQQQIRDRGGRFAVAATGVARRLMSATGHDSVFTLFPDAQAACAELTKDASTHQELFR